MGQVTEHLSVRANHGVGGLLNATFGNAAELIIALMALSKGLIGVVKISVKKSCRTDPAPHGPNPPEE